MNVFTFIGIINRLLPEPHAGLLAGILFGVKSTLDKNLYQALVTTGTLHIAALSGMNITILGSLVAVLFSRFFSKRATSILTIVVIIGFVWLVGASASVIRAAIMGSLALLTVVFGKERWSIYSFIITVGIMLLYKPDWTRDLSFQLSAGATLGIILFGAPKKKSVIEDELRVTLAAQVFTIPLIFFTFHRISLISPLTNLLIGGVISPLTAVGLVMVLVGWVWLPLAQPLAWMCWGCLEYVIKIIEFAAVIPFASLQ